MKALAVALAILALPAAARASEIPRPGMADARIQSVDYDPNQVVLLKAALGNQMMIQFAPGERLENVAIGDSLGWQVTPNKRADLLFLKPIDPHSVTNMTVVTSERSYIFELRVVAKGAPGVTPYLVRFIYPQPVAVVQAPPPPPAPPRVANAAYVVTGAAAGRPTRVFDDGKRVYFQWAEGVDAPAIFAVGADGTEGLVNYIVHDGYTIVDQISPQFRLRKGKQLTTVTNQADAPIQKTKKKTWFWGSGSARTAAPMSRSSQVARPVQAARNFQ